MALKTAKHSGDTSRAAMARRKIMEKATELFSERGYGSVGINEVGQTAGFGKGALYYHIRSKEDLLVSIVSEHLERLIATAEDSIAGTADARERIAAMTAAYVDVLFANPAATTLCIRDVHAIVEEENAAAIRDLHDRYRAIWADVFTAGHRDGAHRAVSSEELDAFVGMLFAAVFWIGEDTTRDTLTETFTGTLTGAVMG